MNNQNIIKNTSPEIDGMIKEIEIGTSLELIALNKDDKPLSIISFNEKYLTEKRYDVLEKVIERLLQECKVKGTINDIVKIKHSTYPKEFAIYKPKK
jgi:hypothetical protein